MRIKRSRAPFSETLAAESQVAPAGATRTVEPVFEQMAREAHARFLVRGRQDDGVAQAVELWLTRAATAP